MAQHLQRAQRARRRFLRTVGSASAAWLLAEKVPFAQTKKHLVIESKEGLVVLNDRPVNAEAPRNPFAWQHWTASLRFPTPGHYEVWVRATDHADRQQPTIIPGWNPRGYLNNAMQRISVKVL